MQEVQGEQDVSSETLNHAERCDSNARERPKHAEGSNVIVVGERGGTRVHDHADVPAKVALELEKMTKAR